MSFGVIVNTSTAAPALGAPTNTGQAFVTGQVSSGPTNSVTLCQSTADFEAAYGPRSGAQVKLWDWLDTAFREGLVQAYVAGYSAAGQYATGLALFDPHLGPGQVV